MKRLRPKNWNEFQHYKRRHPPWGKLHKRLLDDFESQSLPLASKALAPMLWLLASEDRQGWIDAEAAKISFRLRISEEELDQAIQPLIACGFFEHEEDASAALALDMQEALPESEEETEAETEELSDKSDMSDIFITPSGLRIASAATAPSPASALACAQGREASTKTHQYPEDFQIFWKEYPTDAL